jgi:GxxExxY protein
MVMRYENDPLTERIISCALRVSNVLGAGFLEKVYEHALGHEIRKLGHAVSQQEPIKVLYDDVVVGDFFADLLVDHEIIIELKAARAIDPLHEAQLLNYLRATGLRTGLLLNFGAPRLGIKRLVF